MIDILVYTLVYAAKSTWYFQNISLLIEWKTAD